MQETKIFFLLTSKTLPISPHLFQQVECSDYIRLDEILCTVDGSVYMGFRRKIDNCGRAVFLQEFPKKIPIPDTSSDKNVVRIIFKRFQVFKISCIGQHV